VPSQHELVENCLPGEETESPKEKRTANARQPRIGEAGVVDQTLNSISLKSKRITVLLTERAARADGLGPEIDLGLKRGKLLVLTLGIASVIEQESLEVSVFGSEDGEKVGLRPLATFPPKFYCGFYSILLNLAANPKIRFVQVRWRMSRWKKGDFSPMFDFYVYAEESGSRVTAAVA
jgi:hypothetical protein